MHVVRGAFRVCRLVVMLQAVAAVPGCVRQEVPQKPAPSSTPLALPDTQGSGDALVATIHGEWLRQCRGVDFAKKEGWDAAGNAMEGLIKEQSPDVYQALAEYLRRQRSKGDLVGEAHHFDVIAEYVAVTVLACEGPRERLVNFLGVDCPERTPAGPIEYVLADVASDHLRDGMVALCDAYDRARDAADRSRIIAALQRAFADQPWGKTEGPELIRTVREWYSAHGSDVVANEKYFGNEGRMFAGEKLEPLFLPRRPPRSPPGPASRGAR